MDSIEKLYHNFRDLKKISTDTRTDVNGSIFFGLSGEHFNGNQFAENAIGKGASLAVIDDINYKKDERYFLVDNTLKALQALALYHRDMFDIPVVGITGSNGKTTTKELIVSVLSKKYKLNFTEGNLNNHIGVPLTLLSVNEETELAVIEMGANHIGEIKQLCELAKPTVGVITNIGKAHIEGFGSFEGVIKAKNELYQYIRENQGELIVNADDELLMKLSEGINRFTYGSQNTDVIAYLVSAQPSLSFNWSSTIGNFICNSQLYGKYNLNNILTAIAFGIKFSVPADMINQAIESYLPSNNRSQLLNTKQNKIIMDAYNANPVSMREAIMSFAEYKPANPWLIIGDMFELGPIATEEHKRIIELITNENFSNVLLIGNEFYQQRNSNEFVSLETTDEAKIYLGKNNIRNATILIKGSRGMKLEQLLEYL